ncbi:fatty acid synthase-like [Pseudomyrmex gracilis]|uniref:fatty acid synthase-like n=1 Tax=Pseudomyrmex gracilis TaxID=219809 RepID=UPI00099590D9|nr:fatty acid synthase-like [Pseudomyrmex gracilis]
MANKISSWLNASGPSYVVDTACSSSLSALAHAYTRMKNGECDAAIVAGVNLCLNPFETYQFCSLGVLSADGYCRPFDEKGRGYMRSDTVAVLFLQKAKDARRIYATCVHGKTNCDGFKEEGITYPSFEMQKALLEDFYEECKIAPSEISYVEAHGTGTVVGDPVEVTAIDQVFCKNRNSPLLMGSIKSNLGHAEPASGLCQIAKILIAMETGKIPATLHFKSPRKDLTAVLEGRIKIITELTPFNGGYVAVNSFGFGGANCHVILKSNPKNKIKKLDDLPRLVIVSGRTEEAVKTILDDVHNRPIDTEYIALLHSIYNKNIERHPYRGYTIVGLTEDHRSINKLECYSNISKQICFLFPGTDVIWSNIGKDLMKLPIIVKTIQKCDEALKPCGICVTDILLNKNEITCNDSIKSFVAIISIQIAIVDLFLHIGIVPDYVLGQSIGELLCGYVDEFFTVEETILMAYYMSVAFDKIKVEQCDYISAASNQYPESTRLKLLEYLNQIAPYKSMKNFKYSKKCYLLQNIMHTVQYIRHLKKFYL